VEKVLRRPGVSGKSPEGFRTFWEKSWGVQEFLGKVLGGSGVSGKSPEGHRTS